MRLIKFRVTNYKSIEDSGEINVDRVTCQVGKNEAGKTAMLEALGRLKPVEGLSPHFVLEDYPRRKLNEYKRVHEKQPATAITATLELTDEENKAIESEFGTGIMQSRQAAVTKGYDNVLRWNLNINEAAFAHHLIKAAGVSGEVAATLSSHATLLGLLEAAKALKDPTDSVKALAQKIEARKNKSVHEEIAAKCEAFLPGFFYFDAYSTLPGKISLAKLKQGEGKPPTQTEDESLYTALALVRLVGARTDEFLERTNYERLKASLEAASNSITDQVFKFWSQNRQLEVEFDLEPVLHPSNSVLQDTNLHVRIKNQRHRVTVPFDKRSRGFVWFFSFLVAFSDYKSKGSSIILLLDEPGLNLHAKAQDDLLRFIEEELSPNHQVIYTTHSPFMILPSKLERVRTVQDVDGRGTIVSNDPLSNDTDTVFPLQAALGYELAQTLFLGPNTLIVEGPGDLIYMNLAKEKLRADGREALSDKWVIVPVGGADKVATFVSLLGANQLNVAVFLDVSTGDQQRIERLVRDNLLTRKNIVTVGAILGRQSADIEDMFDVNAYLALVSTAYKDVLGKGGITESDLATKEPRIIRRIERHFEDKAINGGAFSHYRPAYVVSRDVDLQKKLLDTNALNNFERAFKQLNALVK